MDNSKLANWLLRLTIIVALAYPAISAFFDPIAWISFVPGWIRNLVNDQAFLFIFSIFEILLILWLIWGKKIFAAALVSAALMFGITILNFNAFEIVFRDIGLGLAALALAALKAKKGARQNLEAKATPNNPTPTLPFKRGGNGLRILFFIFLAIFATIAFYFLTRPEKLPEFTGPAREITVIAKSYSFTPSEIMVHKGERIKLNVVIADDFHDLVIDEFNARTPRISAVATTSVEFIVDKTGEFKYYCSVGSHRQLGMEGTLFVEAR